MTIAVGSYSGKRETNQDYTGTFYNESKQLLAVLCDGMGGHRGGDVASEMAVRYLGSEWNKTSFKTIDEVKTWLEIKINEENKRIYDAGRVYNDLNGMGTTLVAAAVIGSQIVVANVGDSRAYSYQNFQMKLLTIDHSFANELYLNGEITKQEAEVHQQKHMLTRSLGAGQEVKADLFTFSGEEVSYLILCSDGLSNFLSEEEMTTHLMADLPLNKKVKLMIQNAYDNESTDNISIILLDINQLMKGGE